MIISDNIYDIVKLVHLHNSPGSAVQTLPKIRSGDGVKQPVWRGSTLETLPNIFDIVDFFFFLDCWLECGDAQLLDDFRLIFT